MPDPYISEIKFLGGASLDFFEVALDAGSSPAGIQVIIYHASGRVRSINDLGSVDGTVAGRDVYTVDTATSATFTGINRFGAAALVVDGVVTQFIAFDGPVTATAGPANGLTATVLGGTPAGGSLESTDGGGSYAVQTAPTPDTVPCFVAGTGLLTPQGYRPVECLVPGDLVWTEDAGFVPVLWSGARTLTPAQSNDPRLRPLCIPAHAFGPGAPRRDLHLSPNHRIALNHACAELYFREAEVLAPAKALAGYRGIGPALVALPITYHHILLEAHHILRADGLAAESFLPEPVGYAALEPRARRALAHALPKRDAYGPAARLVLTRSETRLLMHAAGEDPLDLPAPAPRAAAA